ncbi:response regulator [Sporomusa aerivorans]|uniref:response regulator n=1 Tax=Sporomusa aerivorans TaxID=204936 RepID=UPI00352AA62E
MARILVVDDSNVTRKHLSSILTNLQHTVVGEASSGAQAFVQYVKLKPDLVTMDWTMPDMTGAEATSKIISSFPEARIVIISALEERLAVLDALERGARHFIIKPIREEKLSQVITTVLQQTLDKGKHLELVKKLRESCNSTNVTNEIVPPYKITMNDPKLVLVSINTTLTATSCKSLSFELEDYLTGGESPLRVILDFGEEESFSTEALVAIDQLVAYIESKAGLVKAISKSPLFKQKVLETEVGNQIVNITPILHFFNS